MDIFNSFYDFFGLDVLSESATFVDLVNNLVSIGLAVFILCFFIKALFTLMSSIFGSDLSIW